MQTITEKFSPDILLYKIQASGFSHREVAEKAGIHPLTLSRWLNGKNKPRPTELVALYRAWPDFTESQETKLALESVNKQILGSQSSFESIIRDFQEQLRKKDEQIDKLLRILESSLGKLPSEFGADRVSNVVPMFGPADSLNSIYYARKRDNEPLAA